jgi:8-oxo-(d)GTP phosphatase
VPILLVRHAKAGSRRQWDGDDRLRPLTDAGQAQARALVDVLAGYRPRRLLSSPYVRCVQTLEPLGRACHVAVEEVDALAEGRSAKSLQLIVGLVGLVGLVDAGGTVAVCTHGDIVPEVLRHVAERDGVELGSDVQWAKGSTWVLEHHEGRFGKAIYRPPPA